MKNIYIIAVFLAFALFAGGCEDTNENLVGSRGKVAVPIISGVNPAVYDVNDLENTYVQFDLDVEDESSLENVLIKVSLNGQEERKTLTTITTFPAVVKVPLADVMSALGVSLNTVELGDAVLIEAFTTSNGIAYPTSSVLEATVVCAYNPSMVVGSYRAVSADWSVDGNVTITLDDEDPYIVYVAGLEEIDGLDEDKGPLKMIIDPLDYSVVAEKTVLASLVTWGAPYHNIAYEGTGKLNTCDGSFSMVYTITVDEGSFGKYAFELTRN